MPRSRPARLALVLALGFVIRAATLGRQSLTMDEMSELAIAHRPLAGIVHAADGFPPLYHLLLAGWIGLFGTEAAARWLALLLGLATIVAIERLASALAGPRVGLWAALLAALSPFAVWYAQEGRAYGLYLLLAAVALTALVRALDHDSRAAWAAYAASALAGLYTHYFFALLVAVGALVAALDRRPGGPWRRPLAAHLAIAVLALPLVALVRTDLAYQAGYPIKSGFDLAALGYTYVSFLTGYTLGPSLRALHGMAAGEAVVGFLPWLVPLGLAAAVLLWDGARALDPRGRLRIALLTLVPVPAIGLLCDLADVGYNVRYALWAAVPLLAWLGTGAAARRRGRWAAAVLLVCFAAALVERHRSDEHRNEDVRALAAWLAAQPADRPVLVISDYMALPVIHALDGRWSVHALPDIAAERDLERALVRIDRAAGDSHYWLVYSRPFHGDPEGVLLDRLAARDGLRPAARFAGIELYRSGPEAAVER